MNWDWEGKRQALLTALVGFGTLAVLLTILLILRIEP